MISDNLMECPKCYSDYATLIRLVDEDGDPYTYVLCIKCGLRSPDFYGLDREEKAEKWWNDRPKCKWRQRNDWRWTSDCYGGGVNEWIGRDAPYGCPDCARVVEVVAE